MIRVFIDGSAGTTGLQLEEKLAAVEGAELLKIDDLLRKDTAARREMINKSDVTFLCLPDDAAREAMTLVKNPSTVIIDASTAHRTHPDWAYGFPELSKSHENAIRTSNRIAVPGCHATGFCAIVYPLLKMRKISDEKLLSCVSLTGYSGGGKAMITEYEGEDPPRGARPYALGLHHKHLPEMKAVCGLKNEPIFQPIVATVRQGMLVNVPLGLDAEEIWQLFGDYYKDTKNITVMPLNDRDKVEMEALNGTDFMEVFVFGHEKHTIITARFDNLGKGASGAALQCMKLRMGLK
ncbi:N-acetyl-gamma-glutamyl-phosphate reductase [Clostridia bacterium]|nr:N-acetyl-gamma-glutamyl-phosphate reductase [Clostridia bacterium]